MSVRTTPFVALAALVFAIAGILPPLPCLGQQTFDPARGILLRGTVVAIVRSGRIVAIWSGP